MNDASFVRLKDADTLVLLCPEEGEAQLERFLAARPDFSLAPITAGEGGAPEQSLRRDGTLRILPHHMPGGCDGFFVARLVRSAALPVSGGAG